MRFTILISFILFYNFHSKLINKDSPVWDDDPSNKRVYKGQGSSGSCQTFAITRGVQLCVNNYDGNNNVEFDSLSYFEMQDMLEPNEFHVSHTLVHKGIKDINSNREFKLSSLPKYQGVSAKIGYLSPGFGITHSKNGYEIMVKIDENLLLGPVSVGVNLNIFNGEIKRLIKDRAASKNLTKNIGLEKICKTKGAGLTHAMLITKRKSIDGAYLYTVIDSAGDPNLPFRNNDAFVFSLTYDEVLSCLSYTVTPINCNTVVEQKGIIIFKLSHSLQ